MKHSLFLNREYHTNDFCKHVYLYKHVQNEVYSNELDL